MQCYFKTPCHISILSHTMRIIDFLSHMCTKYWQVSQNGHWPRMQCPCRPHRYQGQMHVHRVTKCNGGVQYHKVWKPGADWVLKNINDSNDVSYLFWNTRCPLQASLCLQDWHARKKATGVFRFLWQASMAMHWWKQLPFERGHSALENGVASMYRIPWLIYLPITQGFIKMLYRIEYVASYTVDRTLAERHSEWWDAFRIWIHYLRIRLISASFIHHSSPPFAPLSRWIAHQWSPQQSWSESTVVLNYEIREARTAWAWNILQLEVPPKKCCEVDVCDDYMKPQCSYMAYLSVYSGQVKVTVLMLWMAVPRRRSATEAHETTVMWVSVTQEPEVTRVTSGTEETEITIQESTSLKTHQGGQKHCLSASCCLRVDH